MSPGTSLLGPPLFPPPNPGSLAFLTPCPLKTPSLLLLCLRLGWGVIHTVVSSLPLSGARKGFGPLQVEREMKESIPHWSSFRVKKLQDNQAFHTDKSDRLLACPLCVMLLKESCIDLLPLGLHHKMSPLVIPAWYVQGPGRVQGEKFLLAALNNFTHGILLWVSPQLLQTSTLSHHPDLFHSIIHSFSSQNSSCQVLSQVLRLQRQIEWSSQTCGRDIQWKRTSTIFLNWCNDRRKQRGAGTWRRIPLSRLADRKLPRRGVSLS